VPRAVSGTEILCVCARESAVGARTNGNTTQNKPGYAHIFPAAAAAQTLVATRQYQRGSLLIQAAESIFRLSMSAAAAVESALLCSARSLPRQAAMNL
jgi:hypothetical protein